MGCLLERVLFLALCVLSCVLGEGDRNERNEMEDFGLKLKGWRV